MAHPELTSSHKHTKITTIYMVTKPTPAFLPGKFHGLKEPDGLQSMGLQKTQT